MEKGMRNEVAVETARKSVVLFESVSRGWLEVSGEDRVRWLDGMITGDVVALADGPDGAGCPALLLTNRGAIVADFRVGRIGEHFVLESLRSELPRIASALERYIIADDVRLEDRSADFVALGLEGPSAPEILGKALEIAGQGDSLPEMDDWCSTRLADHPVLIGAFGWSGERAYQLRIPVAAGVAVIDALEVAAGHTIERGTLEALEVLRVEAGIPALGHELDEEILPPEARLERAICNSKGCYVGQEIIARLRARGQVNHLLVGVSVEANELPSAGTELTVEGRRTGELTTVVESPTAGTIALAFVRREHSEPGTRLDFEGGAARVADLPFVAVGRPSAKGGSPPASGASAPS
jgi:folate-binding protein YgfZ